LVRSSAGLRSGRKKKLRFVERNRGPTVLSPWGRDELGLRDPSSFNGKDTKMTVSFRKSFSAALLSGAVAIVTPALAGGLILAQASGNSPNATTAPTNVSPGAQPADSAARAAGANAAGAINTNNGVNATGTYGGMGTEPTTPNPALRNPNGIPNLNNTNPTAPQDPLAKKPNTPPQ
jgi:hypothetical protein